MIYGRVSAFRQAIVTLSVRDSNGLVHDFPAVVDTGFTGFATLAPDVIAELGLIFTQTRTYTLGDGNDVEMRLYRADVVWDEQDQTVLVVEADDDALIGMEILEGFVLFIDAIVGGEVRIEPRP